MADYSAVASGIDNISKSVDSITMMQSSRNAQKRAQEYNKEMQQLAWDENLAQWNRENEYRSPENSMKLYKEAGLNPNLIYGQGQVASSSLGNYQAPQTDTGKPPSYKPPQQSMLQNYQNVEAKRLGMNQQKAQINLTQATAENKALEAGLLGQQGTMLGIDIERAKGLLPYDLQMGEANLRGKNKAIDNLIAQKLNIKSQTDLNKARELYQKEMTDLAKKQIFPGTPGYEKVARSMWNRIEEGMSKLNKNIEKATYDAILEYDGYTPNTGQRRNR